MPSSVISNIAYDKRTLILEIKFVSGKVYEYLNVPENVYLNLKSATSKGTYFNLHVKRCYEFRRQKPADDIDRTMDPTRGQL